MTGSVLGRLRRRLTPVPALGDALERASKQYWAWRRDGIVAERYRALGPLLLEQHSFAEPIDVADDAPLPLPDVGTRPCRQRDLEGPAYPTWCRRMGLEAQFARKQWEWVFVVSELAGRGCFRAGTRGVGFGVGRDVISAMAARARCHVLATDLALEHPATDAWVANSAHASSVEHLQHPAVCDPKILRQLVTFRAMDMREIDAGIVDNDFLWSSCALEHLGTIEAGVDFMCDSLATLRPGGVAVHTTEMNLANDGDTIESGETVLYRQRDLTAAFARIERAGGRVCDVDLSPGTGLLDSYLDTPPYRSQPHLGLLIHMYPATSVGIVIEKR